MIILYMCRSCERLHGFITMKFEETHVRYRAGISWYNDDDEYNVVNLVIR